MSLITFPSINAHCILANKISRKLKLISPRLSHCVNTFKVLKSQILILGTPHPQKKNRKQLSPYINILIVRYH